MLAYVFWHRPQHPGASTVYEEALVAFHRSLARSLPVGTLGSATFRARELPWLASVQADGQDPGVSVTGGYEDWYLLEDFAALGVLNEAAVGRGHHSSHDGVARRSGSSAGGLYALVEGEPCAAALGRASNAIWIARPLASKHRGIGELLGDGMEPDRASLWRRQLVFGPAPEFCLLSAEVPPGVGPARLPAGWSATLLKREVLWNG